MPTIEIAELLVGIQRAFKPLKLRWYVFGAQAVIAAGAVRATADLDITTDDVPVDVLRKALAPLGFKLRDDIEGVEDLVAHHRILPLVHRSSGYQLDVVRAGPGLEQEMLTRVKLRRVGRVQVPFVSTDDLVVLKIIASRPKDLDDVRVLLDVARDELDVRVIRERLAEFGSLIDDSTLVATLERLTGEPPRSRRRR